MRPFVKFALLQICFTCVFLTSCGNDDPAPDPELVVSIEQLTVAREGATMPFHVKSSTTWSISSSEDWCDVSPANGKSGTVKVNAVILKNETTSPRTAILTITAGSLTEQITVTQAASVLLTVGQSDFDVNSAGEEIEITVQSSGVYTLEIGDDWVTHVAGSPAASPKFLVASHPGLVTRSTTITFSLSDVTRVVTISQTGSQLNIPADKTGMASDAMDLAANMGAGWNLGNSLEATSVQNGVYTASETMWGNAATTKTLIDAVKAAGFKSVRIPCAWSGYIEDANTYKISDAWLARVKEVVGYCVDNDMYAIINIHWDGGWLEEHPLYSHQEAVNKKQKALWEQIAVAFRDYDEHVLFAGTNEVRANYNNPTAEHIEVQQSYNQTFVDAVRSTGGKNTWRNLVVQGYNTNILHTDNYFTMPADATDDRLIAEVHFYDPWDFAGDGTTNKYLWGQAFAGSANVSSWGQEAWVNEAFGLMKAKFVDNGIPVIVGEYGAIFRTTLPSGQQDHIIAVNNYLHYVTKAARDNGLVPFYWDNGHTGNNSFGLFNRANGQQVRSDAITAIVSAFD